MKYLSVCSGVEAATVAWHSLGWEAVAFSEIEKFPSKVLAHHYPHVPNLGDMTKFEEWNIESIDLLVGGTPCQSFSVAGLRKGLSDPRGNLMLTFGAIANRFRPRWLVWENVPGVLSSNGGRDFGTFLGMLVELGYGWSYRVLDAQYFGVAQRRRRVFVVGYLGDFKRAAAVLFERHSLSGNPPPSRKKGEEVAGTIAARFGISRNNYEELVPPQYLGNAEGGAKDIPFLTCHNAGGTAGISNQTPLIGVQPSYSMITANTGSNGLGVSKEIALTLDRSGPAAIAQPKVVHGTQDPCISDVAFAQGTNSGQENVVVNNMSIRRLMPVECERLQGFPDNYTNIPNAADGPRYKALGNSMAVPVMHWIGKRIQQVEDIVNKGEVT